MIGWSCKYSGPNRKWISRQVKKSRQNRTVLCHWREIPGGTVIRKQPRGTQSDDVMYIRFASMSTCRLRNFFDGTLRIERSIPVTHVVFQTSAHRPLGGEMDSKDQKVLLNESDVSSNCGVRGPKSKWYHMCREPAKDIEVPRSLYLPETEQTECKFRDEYHVVVGLIKRSTPSSESLSS